MGIFGDLFSGKGAGQAQGFAALGRDAGLKQATGTLNEGYGDASKYLDTASGRFDPLAKTANSGFDAYAQLFGIGGGDPTAAVRAQPGYQFSQDEGQEAVLRNQNAIGAGASGDTLNAVFARGANIADTKWKDYASGLLPFLQLAPQIAGQQGGYDAAQGGLETDLAKTLAQYQTGTANANANGIIEAQNAKTAASKNVFDAVMGGAKLAVGAATGGASLPFTNMFGGSGAAGGER